MSRPWTITLDGFYRDAKRRLTTTFACFDVERAGGGGFRFVAGFTVQLRDALDLDGDDVLARLIADAGLDDLETGLTAGLYPATADEEHEHGRDLVERLFTTEDRDHVKAFLPHDKRCLWQDRSPRGWICKATSAGHDVRTTVALCSGCTIPDERVVCVHLVHPSVTYVGTPERGKRIASALCNLGHEAGDGTDCRPAGLQCWQRQQVSRPSFVDPPFDVSRRAADEIDYLTLIYRDRYNGARLWTLPQARTISELFGECEGAEDFQRRVATVADLLSRLSPYDQLDESERLDAQGNRVGSLVALERLIARDHPEAVDAVRILRAIADARNAFPIHTRSERLRDALATLGVDFPPGDWRLAWLRVLTAFWSSLQSIRIAIQTAAPAEG